MGLIEDPRLRVCRAPGNTGLSSLEASAHLGDLARNNSKGCGTIMRFAPIALMFPRYQVRRMAIETSALTHGHVTGQLAAAVWAEMLAGVVASAALEESETRTAEIYARLEGARKLCGPFKPHLPRLVTVQLKLSSPLAVAGQQKRPCR